LQKVFLNDIQKEAHFEVLGLLIQMAQKMPITPTSQSQKDLTALKFVLENLSFDYSNVSLDYSSVYFIPLKEF
jgi:hypothetical protein